MPKNPAITVLMPTFNAEKTIERAVFSILGQSYGDFEFVIIDDASTDQTFRKIKKIKDKRIKYFINTARRGVAETLNIGLKHSKGRYLARMDADDISMPARLKQQYNFLNTNKEYGAVGSFAFRVNQHDQVLSIKAMPISDSEIKLKALRFNPFIHPTIMLRKSVFNKIGQYNPKFDGAEDYDLFLRIIKNYKVKNIPIPLLKHRISSNSVTGRNPKFSLVQAQKVRIHALKKYGYPAWQYIYLIKPFFSNLVPISLKKTFYA